MSSINLFDTSGFVPRWRCGAWPSSLGWLHIASDLMIWVAYLTIPMLLAFFIRHRRDTPFPRVFWLFSAFIVACGSTHLLEAVIFYFPLYRLAGILKLVTAVISWVTVIALIPVLPKALALRTPRELEQEVIARTGELAAANDALQVEVENRKRTEATVLETSRQIEQQSQMLDQVSDAVSVVDAEGRITYWNLGATRLFGWSAGEVLGRTSPETLYRGDPKLYEEMLRETNARRSWAGELTKVTRSGTPIIVEHRRTLLQNASGEVTGYLCIDIDITTRKKRERAAHRSQRLESIGTLAGGIAHDLNNVLTPILMGAKLLSSGRDHVNQQGLLDTMAASAQRGADLVKQVLSFAGGVRGERIAVKMQEVVAETLTLLEHTLPKSIQIETAVDADCPTVLGDPTEMSQVLMNLCINARDAMADGGHLSIRVTSTQLNENATQLNPEARPGLYVLLKVSDTGTGMGPEVLDRIFDPFFTTKDIGKGTGLGLATVQGIVKHHGGFINVYSELGHGTKFSVYVPAVTVDAATNQADDSFDGLAEVSGDGQTLLLVDDEAFILRMTATALETAGYHVMTALDGAAAISIYSKHTPTISAVLLDMMMPGLDGLQTIDQLRQIDPNVVIIACSGLRTAQREAEVLQRGTKAFLPKPYDEQQLLQTLARVLEKDAHSVC